MSTELCLRTNLSNIKIKFDERNNTDESICIDVFHSFANNACSHNALRDMAQTATEHHVINC